VSFGMWLEIEGALTCGILCHQCGRRSRYLAGADPAARRLLHTHIYAYLARLKICEGCYILLRICHTGGLRGRMEVFSWMGHRVDVGGCTEARQKQPRISIGDMLVSTTSRNHFEIKLNATGELKILPLFSCPAKASGLSVIRNEYIT
jgi:hypothetical protein